jgi:CDP-glycerol glycerophosphotransferase
VVPVYNLAHTLPACLASVLSQPVPELEVVVVDDGSLDDSAEVAERIAREDPRVRVIRQANGGVSRARNAALEACTGDLVTFVDPDDVLPADAWRPMLRSLSRTGSDFAVGMMERVYVDGRRTRPPLLARNHASARASTTIEESPLLIADVFPCNKIFRMDFWRDAGLSFLEGTDYEDQVMATDAFLASRSFDVLTEVVYDWHIREDQSSATQRRAQLQNLVDRIRTKQISLDKVRAYGHDELTRVFYTEVLPIDMWEHFRAAVAPDTAERDRYWETLRAGLVSIWNDETFRFEESMIPVGQRLMGWLVEQDRRDDLARLIAEIDGDGVPVVDGMYRHPWIDEPLPERLRRA